MSQERIALSERWTKIATILPNSINSTTNHPSLYVDPSGFRRVVAESLTTCEKFLTTCQWIEDALEKRINGITSYYSLVVAPNRQSPLVRQYGGIVNVSGSMISIDPNYLTPSSMHAARNVSADTAWAAASQPEPQEAIPPETKRKTKASIFQKIGDIILCNDRRITDSEVISFNRGLEILTKLDSMREITINCITTFGALDEILQVGKVFSYRTEENVHYVGEHAIREEKNIREDMMQLQGYWGILACTNRIRTIEKKLAQPMKNM